MFFGRANKMFEACDGLVKCLAFGGEEKLKSSLHSEGEELQYRFTLLHCCGDFVHVSCYKHLMLSTGQIKVTIFLILLSLMSD